MRDDSSSSGSDSEASEQFSTVLKEVGLNKKYGKIFKKAKIIDVDDASDLSESKLKKLGINSSTDRKKILKALEEILSEESSSESDSDLYDSASSSESEEEPDEYDLIKRALEKQDLEKYAKKLKRNGVDDVASASKMTDRKLKKIGVESSKSRTKILEVFAKLAKVHSRRKGRETTRTIKKRRESGSTHSSTSASSDDSKSNTKSEKKIILNILKEDGLTGLQSRFVKAGLTTFKAVEALTPEALKELDLDTVAIRSRVLDLFRSEKLDQFRKKVKRSSSSESETENTDPMYVALKRVGQEKHYKLLRKRGIKTVREAQELNEDKLFDLGIANAGQRMLIMEGILEADWKCEYCTTWNEHRKTCVVCTKTFRPKQKKDKVDDEDGEMFELKDKVKYIGKFRALTKTATGAKGEIYRVLEEGKFYMVDFVQKDGKTVKIRLPRNELKRIKSKR